MFSYNLASVSYSCIFNSDIVTMKLISSLTLFNCCLVSVLGEGIFRPLNTILDNFKMSGARCVTTITDKGSFETLTTFPSQTYDIQSVAESDLRTSSENCPFFLILAQDMKVILDFVEGPGKELSRRDAHYAFAFSGNNSSMNSPNPKKWAPLTKFLQKVIIVKRGDIYFIYHLSLCKDASPELRDIWQINYQRPLFGSTKLSCLEIRATTFQYEPFIKVTQDDSGNLQYGGFEVGKT
jgi:hypothetical protein